MAKKKTKKKTKKDVVKTKFAKAEKSIKDAKKMGVDVEKALQVFSIAKEIAKSNPDEAVKVLEDITAAIKEGKKKKRLERMIQNTQPTIDKAKQAGGDITIAVEWLEKARKQIDEGVFGTAQEYINNARREADEAKKFMFTRELITQFAPDVDKAKREGVDISEVMDIITKAWEALNESKFDVVKTRMKEAKKLLNIAEDSMQFVEMVKQVEQRMTTVRDTGAVTPEMNKFLLEALNALKEKDYVTVKRSVQKINDRLDKAVLYKDAGMAVTSIRHFIKEARKSGYKTRELEQLLGKASIAFNEGNLNELDGLKLTANKIVKNLKLFDKLKSDEISIMDDDMKTALSDWISNEVKELEENAEQSKADGKDVSDMVDQIGEAKAALERKDIETAVKIVQSVKGGSPAEHREEVSKAIETSANKLKDAKMLGMDVSELQAILDSSKSMIEGDSVDEAVGSLDKFESEFKAATSSYLDGKHPRIQVMVDGHGFEAQKWNRCFLRVENKGNTAVRDLHLNFSDNVEVDGLMSIPKLMPDKKVAMEVAVKSPNPGKVPIEISASYRRFFDETKYQLNDVKDIEVEDAGSYIIEDVFLIHKTGLLIARETRRIQSEVDSDIFSAMLTAVTEFVKDSFHLSGDVSLNRMDFGESRLIIERGEHVYLAVTVLGQESDVLPFYMTEIVDEIEETFGTTLAEWMGEIEQLEGIEEIIRKIIFVKDDRKLDMPVMPGTKLGPTFAAMESGTHVQPMKHQFSEIMAGLVQEMGTRPYNEVMETLANIDSKLGEMVGGPGGPGGGYGTGEGSEGPDGGSGTGEGGDSGSGSGASGDGTGPGGGPGSGDGSGSGSGFGTGSGAGSGSGGGSGDGQGGGPGGPGTGEGRGGTGTGPAGGSAQAEMVKRVHDMLISQGKSFGKGVRIDERLNSYLERISEAKNVLDRYRKEKNIPENDMIAQIAVQPADFETWSEIETNLMSIVQEQLNVVDAVVLKPGERWSGFEIKIRINEALIREKYRHIASNVISVLKYMPADKMAVNLKKPEFTIGVEGQTIHINPEMVSAEFDLPRDAGMIKIPGGKIYVKETMTEEAEVKLLLRSIKEQIAKMRADLELPELAIVMVQIFAPDRLAETLEWHKDEIKDAVGAFDVELPFDDPFGEETDYHVVDLAVKEGTIRIGIIEVEFVED